MERKIGEIFEFGGEWYQCLKSASCDECAFLNSNCIDNPSLKCSVDDRTDNCSVIFKKLEKWREPYPNADKLYQLYKLPMNIEKLPPHTEGINLVRFDIVEIEIKQNKEDMEEKYSEFTDIVHEYMDKDMTYKDFKEAINDWVDDYIANKESNKPNLKPFDIQKAKEGKPVCTRDGHKARIICFDYNGETGDYPIVALVHYNKENKCYERVLKYTSDGLFNKYRDCQHNDDLMMSSEKKEG